MQRALVHTAVGGQAARLLVVGGKMLDGGADPLALHALDESGCKLARQVGILGVILKIAAAERAALDVHRRPQQNLHAAGPGLPPEGCAHAPGQCRVEGCCRRAPCGEAHGLNGIVGVGAAFFLGAQAVGAIADLDSRDAQPLHCLGVPEIRARAQPGLFFQRQGADKLFDVHGGSPYYSMGGFPHYNTPNVQK